MVFTHFLNHTLECNVFALHIFMENTFFLVYNVEMTTLFLQKDLINRSLCPIEARLINAYVQKNTAKIPFTQVSALSGISNS